MTAERMIGATLDFVDLPPDEQALKAGRPVVRLVTLGAAGIVPDGFATGFLVAPDLITKKTGVVFDATLMAADVLKSGGADERVRGFKGKRITKVDQVVLR